MVQIFISCSFNTKKEADIQARHLPNILNWHFHQSSFLSDPTVTGHPSLGFLKIPKSMEKQLNQQGLT